jgi:drug/metabolite transporter (DMT)-like permease
LILLPLFFKYRNHLKTKKFGFYFWRSFLVALSIYCSTYGVKHLALVDAVLLQYTFPLFISLMLLIFYKRRISLSENCALLIGFSSVFFLLKPQLDIFHLASFAPLGAALASAALAISLYELVKTEHVIAILFYCTLIPGCFCVVPFIYSRESIPSSVIWIYLILSSFLGVIYQYLMAKAYSLISPHIVGSFSYFCVLFCTLFGWLIWNETLDGMKIIGGILVVACGLLMVYKNHRKIIVEKNFSADNSE